MSTKLGQNFLIDKNIAEKEIEYADVDKNDVVLEIGPGRGILTKILSEKAKKVLAVEIDPGLVKNLQKILPGNVEIINSDVLDLDFKDITGFNKVVSNLPFEISSPVTFKLLESGFDLAVLIYQKEFAERLVAEAGSKKYSRLSVNVYYRANCEMVQTVSKNCFSPVPRVDSAIVRMVPRKTSPFDVFDEKLFFDLTKNLFEHRRKKIKTVLKSKYKIVDFEKIPFVDERVENLSPWEIGILSNKIFDFLK